MHFLPWPCAKQGGARIKTCCSTERKCRCGSVLRCSPVLPVRVEGISPRERIRNGEGQLALGHGFRCVHCAARAVQDKWLSQQAYLRNFVLLADDFDGLRSQLVSVLERLSGRQLASPGVTRILRQANNLALLSIFGNPLDARCFW